MMSKEVSKLVKEHEEFAKFNFEKDQQVFKESVEMTTLSLLVSSLRNNFKQALSITSHNLHI